MNEIFEKVDAILIKTPDDYFFYFTRYQGMWENSFAIVFPDKIEIIAPPLEEGEAHFYKDKKEMEKLLKELLNVEKIGFNGEGLSYSDYKYLKKLLKTRFIDISKHLKEMRIVKSNEEIKAIRKAHRITMEVLNKLEMEGKNERDVAFNIECGMKKRNAVPAFPTIVAFGKNTASPHHTVTNKKFVMPALIDAGAKYNGYCADITRSFVKRKGKKLYEIVEHALHIAIDEMKEGVKAKEVYGKVEKFFAKYGYKMRHALGHSIGINVHDGYSINKKANFMLKENMVFAVEPAIYLKNYGIRIGENISINKNKAE